MKKILSLVLVFALVLGSFGSFAATDEQVRIAEILKGYKVLVGDESGDLMLDQNMTREQALVVLARFMGVESEAGATSIQASFTDVDHPYYEPFIAYAELKGWTNGLGDGTFGYGQDVTVQMFTAYMLRALGQDAAWDDTMKVAKELKLFANSGDLDPEASITRGNAAVVMNDTLETVPANSEFKLKQVLGLESVNTGGVAEIVSVEATNLKQMVVTLSAPLEKAGDTENWSVNKDANFKLKGADFELSEDGKMVTITLADGEVAKQQEKVKLTVKDLLEDDITVEVMFLDVEIPEATAAEVIGINTIKVTFSEPLVNAAFGTTGKKFYTVKNADGKTYYVKAVKAQNHNTEALVELYTDLKEGDYTMKVAATGKDGKNLFRDYQDYTVKTSTFDLKVVVDKDKPVVESFEDATRYQVTLVFNEDVRFAKELKADYIVTDGTDQKVIDKLQKNDKDAVIKKNSKVLKMFYHTNTLDTPYKIKKSGNKVTLYFTDGKDKDSLLPEGTAYVYIKEAALEDYWENENEDLAYKIEVEVDEEAPYVAKYDVKEDGKKVELKFNEIISNPKKVEVKVLDENGKEVKGHKWLAATTEDEKSVLTLQFKKALEYGEYEFMITKAKDRANNVMDEQKLDVTVKDEKQPDAVADKFKATLYKEGTEDQVIIIDFKQKMDKESITNPDNFALYRTKADYEKIDSYNVDSKNSELFNNLSKAEFVAMDNNSKVKILIPYDKDETDKSKTFPNFKEWAKNTAYVRIGRLKDAAGNKMTTYSANLIIKHPTTVSYKAELVDSKTIKVTVEANVADSYDSGELTLYKAKTASTTPGATEIKAADMDTEVTADKTVFIFTLKEEDRLNPIQKGTSVNNMIYAKFTSKEDEVEDIYGNDVDPAEHWVADKASPEVLGIYLDASDKKVDGKDVKATTASAIYVVVSEKLNASHFAPNGNNDFTDADEVIKTEGAVVDKTNVTVEKTFGAKKFYVIKINAIGKDDDKKLITFTDDDTISYVGVNLVDEFGNKLEKFDDMEIKGSLNDLKKLGDKE